MKKALNKLYPELLNDMGIFAAGGLGNRRATKRSSCPLGDSVTPTYADAKS
ncbi:MAG: hypothetical protein AAF467_27950 [Actinomycetota bacterium]